jgi:cytochrome c oxidase subunit 3
VLFFSGLFVAYILYRHHRPEIFEYASHYLDVKWGAINTAVLIISSLTAAWSVRCAQLGNKKGLIATLAITILCALGFLGIKGIEYSHKIHEGILFGRYFDPCVTSGGGPALNKSNHCHGTKSSVEYDPKTKKAEGCLGPDLDQRPDLPGVQLVCKVEELTGHVTTEAGKPPHFAEQSRREIPACAPRTPGTKTYATPLAFPCFEMHANPAVCEVGAGAIVRYGDSKARGHDVRIETTCEKAPAVVAPADAFADPTAVAGLGKANVSTAVPLDKHGQIVEFSLGPPPEHTNMFFSIYFAMTGLHGIHVLVGILIYIWLLGRALKGHFTPDYFGPIDYAALYWHLVDLIWIFLFPLLYLIH